MTKIIDGKAIAAEIRAELKEKTEILNKNENIQPGLAVLLVGEDPASNVYVNMKEKACLEIGYKSIVLRKSADITEEEVLKIVNDWNNDPSVHGILVQLPLPRHINENKVILSISPMKDVDGFHPESFGRLLIGLPGFVSCTPAGIMELLKRTEINMKGKHVVVVGRSNIVGKPVANLLYQKNPDANAVVTICHTGADDITKYTKQADVLIAAVGVPELIKAEDVKEGVVVIDVGMNRVEDSTKTKGYRLTGDVDFNNVKEKAFAITPVPGGVGPMTIAMLLVNTFKSASGELFQ
ncbi:bifunctional methylenetetrahydrofolate dehydrogenase/methenyltetrahydrofolate cyclohydrolase FolD [Bacteroidota bacterium]